jgi:distribution and morphology protein 31
MRSPSEFCSHQKSKRGVLFIHHPVLHTSHIIACFLDSSPPGEAVTMLGVSTARQALRTIPRAGPSRHLVTRSAQSDRYTAIHAFFTRQALSVTPPKSAIRTLVQRRWNSTNKPQEGCENCSERRPTIPPKTPPPPSAGRQDHAQDYTPFIKRLIASSKVLQSGSPHRPSKEQLLAAASGWWQRLRIRIKWFTIRGWRRFNTDDFSAFASWFVVGNSESEVAA